MFENIPRISGLPKPVVTSKYHRTLRTGNTLPYQSFRHRSAGEGLVVSVPFLPFKTFSNFEEGKRYGALIEKGAGVQMGPERRLIAKIKQALKFL